MTEQSIALLEDALVIELDVDADQARRILDYLMAAGLLADRRLAECAVCRRPFVVGGSGQRYCSKSCRNTRYRQTRLPEQADRDRTWYQRHPERAREMARLYRERVAARRAAA